MSHRPIKAKDFEGKTIAKMDCHAVNIIRFYFTDGTAIAIETDAVGAGIYGMVACDTCAAYDPPKKRKKHDPSTPQVAVPAKKDVQSASRTAKGRLQVAGASRQDRSLLA